MTSLLFRVLILAGLMQAAAYADAGWPESLPADWSLLRPGGGLAIVGLTAWWVCVLGWSATVAWVARDALRHGVRPTLWIMAVAVPFVVAMLLAWWLQSTLGGLLLVLPLWLASVMAYAMLRNRRVAESERILTAGHAHRLVAGVLTLLGIDRGEAGDESEASEVLPVVNLLASGGRDAVENNDWEQRAGATPGFREAITLMQGAVMARAASVCFESDPQGMLVSHEVDGVWEKPRVRKPPRSREETETFLEAPRPSRESTRAVIDTLAILCGLPRPRSGRTGGFVLEVDGKPCKCRLQFLRTAAGVEQVVVHIESNAMVFKEPADIGMPAALAAQIGELLALEQGLFVVSSPPGGGLTTTFDVVVQVTDRLLRDFVSIEDAATPPRGIQNVKPVQFDARSGVTPLDALSTAMRGYPRAIVTRDLRDRELAVELSRLAADNQLVIVSMKASDATDAVARLLACGIAPDVLARTLVGSLAQRLVRKLCPKCREEYPTPGEVLARLKTTPDDLPHLRKPSAHGCRLCRGTGYLGRTAVFELASGLAFREAIAAKADQKMLRHAAVLDGMQSMRQAGMALVKDGITSMEEMQRVFASVRRKTTETPVS